MEIQVGSGEVSVVFQNLSSRGGRSENQAISAGSNRGQSASIPSVLLSSRAVSIVASIQESPHLFNGSMQELCDEGGGFDSEE